MRDLPILMSAPMVLALLAGRKTVTRRLSTKATAGDVLWVRETLKNTDDGWTYAADGAPVMVAEDHRAAMLVWAHHKPSDHCVSIHMPRFACRLRLEVTSVRQERLHDVDNKDALREGLELQTMHDPAYRFPRDRYAALWDKLNADRGFSWASNPLCWRIEFRVL
jgi:hypothetical protein